MLLARLTLGRAGSASAFSLYSQHGTILSRQSSCQQIAFYSAVPLRKGQLLVPLMKVGWCQGRHSIRFSSHWVKRADRYLKNNRELILTLTLGVFMAYFLMLRQSNGIDEHMSRPIWERVPGIDPERAEQMMELDRRLGLQVDKTGLEEYKKKYYAAKLLEMQSELKAENKHRELREASQSHFGMLQDYADHENKRE